MSQRLKVLLAILFLAVYTMCATFTMYRNCSLCHKPIMKEYVLAVGAGSDHTIVHQDCLVDALTRKIFSKKFSAGDLVVTYSLEEN